MQKSIEGKSGFEDISDEFATLQDINIPESTRLALMRNVQAFIDQSKAVADLQQSIINVPGFDTLADEFATLQDFDIPESARLNLQRLVQTYIAQIKQFQEAQRDLTIGTGADPIIARYKTERLDTIEQKLRDINTTEGRTGTTHHAVPDGAREDSRHPTKTTAIDFPGTAIELAGKAAKTGR